MDNRNEARRYLTATVDVAEARHLRGTARYWIGYAWAHVSHHGGWAAWAKDVKQI